MPRITKAEKQIRELNQVTDAFERALNFELSEPDVSLIQDRKCAEGICKHICMKEGSDKSGKPLKKMMLEELIGILRQKDILTDQVYYSLLTI